ncbi:DNA replication protein [Lactococcus hircilactis]|uniref:DNA replication protein n=1 Tax=Lactococcus hircilactis TaxID=1494462 RepID=A0A7X2D1K8_9LACT|nr:conserved phage C-terminal domain-containing protein [Lactococcus hircilactis]MQW39577.1 DNA replication protein [Lactococcus hircilactis]
MAQRRMFSKEITTSDLFVEMPSSSRLLYYDLGMEADDEGFIGNARMLSRAYGASSDDLKLLATKGFIIMFPNGVTVVKDWNLNNKIRKDRQKPTIYTEEKSLLTLDSKGSYLINNQMSAVCQPIDNQMSAQDRIGKESLGKESIGYNVEENFIFPDYLSEKTIESIKKGNPKNFNFRIPIAYLNQVTGKNFQFVEKSMNLIKARLKDGFVLDDFKKVIDIKFNEWSNTDMAKYIRPETLFGNKFDGYLNQMALPSKQGSQEYCDDLPF